MTETLRDRQKQMARELIMQAAADLIVEDGLESLALADVAERAGVSKRTLYNYFDSRETLLSDMCDWSAELTFAAGGVMRPEGLDTLPEIIRNVWRAWDQQGTLNDAVLRIEAASSDTGVSPQRADRRRALTDAVLDLCPSMTDDQAADVASFIHAVTSASTYRRVAIEDELGVERAGVVLGWAIELFRDALESGNHPFTTEE